MSKLKPKLFSVMKGYTKAQFFKDFTAGIIVAIIAFPLSIALAIASGVAPERGLYTAIVAGFIISFLGGSRVQIGGPTGAFMVIVLGVIAEYGFEGLVIATFLAGIIMILFGLAKLGSVVKFIPYPIVTGFTTGIALVIFTSQVQDFFGMGITNLPGDFLGKWGAYFTHIGDINPVTLGIGALTLLILIFWPKISKKIPGTLVAIVVATALTYFLGLDIETIGSKYGVLASTLPAPSLPSITFDKIKTLLEPAFVIAFLGSVESLLSAVVSDGMIGSRHRSNMELVAQGVANIGSSVFGGIPATGAIARTVANIKNGGRTPIAGMTHAVVVLLMMLFLMPLVQHIPLSSLAAVLFMVAYNMSDLREFKTVLKSPLPDTVVLLTTFGLTVVVDLVVAIEIGLVMSMFLFMKRMSDVSDVSIKKLDFTEETKQETLHEPNQTLPQTQWGEGVQMYQINGPFFFGAAHKFVDAVKSTDNSIRHLIVGMKHVPAMDATAIHYFKSTLKTCESKKITLYITGLKSQPKEALEKAGVLEKIGPNRMFATIEEAVAQVKIEKS
ncbi:MAG: sulfate permease [Candidatus Izemoplasmatales bacterium]|nr:sulfate permease [Candidatus Izemoplasmatales bacterium]